jgi:hypothetical protein
MTPPEERFRATHRLSNVPEISFTARKMVSWRSWLRRSALLRMSSAGACKLGTEKLWGCRNEYRTFLPFRSAIRKIKFDNIQKNLSSNLHNETFAITFAMFCLVLLCQHTDSWLWTWFGK